MKKILQWTAVLLTAALLLGSLPSGGAVVGCAEGKMTSLGSVVAGNFLSYLLQPDGTVAATGNWRDGACNVSHWRNIVKVAAYSVVLGLCSDGTVLMAGTPPVSGFDVSGWRDIVDIAVGVNTAIGLRRDGTVVFTGMHIDGQERMLYWSDIIQVAADDCAYYGLRSDGTVVTVSGNGSSKTRCMNWRNIVSISAAMSHILGLRSDGTVVAEGSNLHNQLEVNGWRNVVAIAAGNHYSVALLRSGRVVCTGENDYGQCDTQNWQDIVDISAGMLHTIGLRKDGRIVTAGSDGYGQRQIEQVRSLGTWKEQSPVAVAPASPATPVYLNEMPYSYKYGKLWTRSMEEPSTYYHTKQNAPSCWADMNTPGHTKAAVRDADGNAYTYGMHLDGKDTDTYSISYRLDGRYTRFTGVCGYPAIVINEIYSPWYHKYFNVYGDGRLLYTSPTMGSGYRSAPFSIDVTGVQVLEIEYPPLDGPNEVATLFDGKLS